MISLRYYLDTRKPPRKQDGRWPLKLVVCKRRDTAMMPTVVYLKREEWDADAQRVARPHPQRSALNDYLDQLRIKTEGQVRQLVLSGEAASMTCFQLRDRLVELNLDAGPGVSLKEYYESVRKTKKGATAKLFGDAWKVFVRGYPKLEQLPLSSLNVQEVARVDAYLMQHYSLTTRNTYISKLTLVAKKAHREGLVQADAGRDVKMIDAIPKSRALTVEQLRMLFAAETPTERYRESLDLFKLSFYLRGMNGVDISKARPDDISNGRLIYQRSKTGKGYSVKVEPEAEEVIRKYSDRSHIFAPMSKMYTQSRFAQEANSCLQKMAKKLGLPRISLYWARHTFASLIIETGTTMEILAGALGHSYGPKVTAGYVTLQQRQVDEAARKVFDFVAGK